MNEPRYGPNPTSQGVRGYRDLTAPEIDTINIIKEHEEILADTWGKVERLSQSDSRWLGVARTHFQEGFSALVRAIAQPDDPFQRASTNNQQDEAEGIIPRKSV